LQAQLDELLLALLARQSTKPHDVVIGLFGFRQHMFELAQAYRTVARGSGARVEMAWYSLHRGDGFRRHRLTADAIDDFLADPDAGPGDESARLAGAGVRHAPAVRARTARSWRAFESRDGQARAGAAAAAGRCGQALPPRRAAAVDVQPGCRRAPAQGAPHAP